jgi:hypothetical protein
MIPICGKPTRYLCSIANPRQPQRPTLVSHITVKPRRKKKEHIVAEIDRFYQDKIAKAATAGEQAIGELHRTIAAFEAGATAFSRLVEATRAQFTGRALVLTEELLNFTERFLRTLELPESERQRLRARWQEIKQDIRRKPKEP